MEKLIGIKELSEVIGISLNTLYNWTCTKRIPHYKISNQIRFRVSQIEKWLASQSVDCN